MFAIGIDLGATKLAVAAVDSNGTVINKSIVRTPQKIDEMINTMQSAINIALADIPEEKMKGIGIGAAGPVDYRNQSVTEFPNIPGMGSIALSEIISEKTGWPVKLDNDGNVATLGEKMFGAAKGKDFVVGLTLGTGIGSGIILKGKIQRGFRGTGAEIGHMVIDMHGPECKCGNSGCFETYVSGPALASAGGEAIGLAEASEIAGIQLKSKSEITSEIILMGAIKGNRKCIALVRRMAKYLGVGFSNILNILNPEIIVVGGGLGSAGFELFIDDAISEMTSRGLKANLQGVEIKKTELGNDAGIIGAAALFF